MIDTGQLAGLACVFMRMSGCIIFNPLFGRRNFPMMFQIGVTLMLSILIASYSEVVPDFDGLSFIATCAIFLKELLVGLTMGAIVSMFTYVVILGGELIDLQAGLSMSHIYDPQSGIQMSVNATFFNLMFVFIFFGMNAHLTLIHMFLASEEVVPYGAVSFPNTELFMKIPDVFCQCTILGLKIAMPVVGIQFLLEMAVGILMKTIPQINVFVVNLQVKILVGLLMILAIFTPLSNFIEQAITFMFEIMGSALVIM